MYAMRPPGSMNNVVGIPDEPIAWKNVPCESIAVGYRTPVLWANEMLALLESDCETPMKATRLPSCW